ncbi:MAG: hypothetical protein RMI45_08740 [Ignisphaera sp.]|nr:hypothetical protein [Ignisphaera sp.]
MNSSKIFFTPPLLLYALVFSVSVFVKGFPNYFDEVVYIECGLKYVSGCAPYLCNFEHPPFGKYLIGILTILGISRPVFIFIGALSSFLVCRVCSMISGSSFLGFLAGLLLALDTLFLNVHRFLLLDPVAVFLFLLGLYTLLHGRIFISSVLCGLAAASKFSIAPLLLVPLYMVYRVRGFRQAVLFTLLQIAVYISTYLADLALGLDTILKHHIDMIGHLSWSHGFSPSIAANGLLKLLTKAELWRFSGELTIILSNVSGSYTVLNTTFTPQSGLRIDVGLGMGSILWYLHIPVLLYTTQLVLAGKGFGGVAISTLLSWLSIPSIIAGPIDWYYTNVLPPLYINTVLGLHKLLGTRFKWIAPLILGLSTAVTIAAILGLIPYKIRLAQ